MRFRMALGTLVLACLLPAAATGQPWKVVLSVNPIRIGTCNQVGIRAYDPGKNTNANNGPVGTHYVSMPDFNMSAQSAGGIIVGKYEGTIWNVCACRRASVGAQGTITANYPAQGMPADHFVGGMPATTSATVQIIAGTGVYDPPGCAAAGQSATVASGRTAPTATLGAPKTTVPTTTAVSPTSAPKVPLTTAASTGRTPSTPTALAPPIAIAPATTSVPTTITPSQILPITSTATGTTNAGPVLGPTARMTSFKPSVSGFRFINNFTNVLFGSPLNATSSGLCGGMTYAALDYYYSGKQIPDQDYRPANGTTLQQYLYGRQSTSLVVNADRWIDLQLNPFGARTLEFFNDGISGQLTLLRSFIDRNVPVPLGLKGSEPPFSQSHQVLAIGYDVGRYQGSLGAYKEDVKIYVMDPNFPNTIKTLVPDESLLEYHYSERPDERWRTYFVDGKYTPVNPPGIPSPVYPNDSLIHELRFEFTTGADDMRGGADHVDIKLILTNSTTQNYTNVTQTGRLIPNYSEIVSVILTQPVAPEAIRAIQLSTNATTGIDGDNWDMAMLAVTAVGGNFNRRLRIDQMGPYRFPNGGIPYITFTRCCFW
jgi:Predicted solute binding protein